MSTKNYVEEEEEKKELSFKENKTLFIKTKLKKAGLAIWNNKEKEFFGRDSLSWTYVGLMYFIYYGVLGGFSWAMIAIFMGITKSTYLTHPKYIGTSSPISSDGNFYPGMGMRPHIGTGPSEIEFNMLNPNDYKKYVENLDIFLRDYEKKNDVIQNCESLENDILNQKNSSYCYDFKNFLNKLNCSRNESYGFSSGSPCVLLKLNQIFSWEPGNVIFPLYENVHQNSCLIKEFDEKKNKLNHIFFSCKGDSESDNQNINWIKYGSPKEDNSCFGSIPFYFYPYRNEENYTQPLVVVKLNVSQNQKIMIKCDAWAENILRDSKKGYGSITFSLKITS